jgi:predicted dinucleotide-binding enzyme
MRIGIIGSGRIGVTAAKLFTRAGHEVAIGFAAVDTGPLGEGGRRQQAGGPLSNPTMTAPEAERALAEA